MTSPTANINYKTTDPSLSDLLQLLKKDILLSTNCHAVATIQIFDSSAQTVQATINYKKSILTKGADGTYATQLVDYPILIDVPVIILGGGTAHLTFPIKAGDECMVLFNDRDIDNWHQSGQNLAPASNRLHSFSDGIALIGVNSSQNVIKNYDSNRAKLFNDHIMVGVSPTGVKIANETDTLGIQLQALITAIEALVTATAAITVTCAIPGSPSSPPINAAAITAVATTLATVATKLAGILE